MDENQSRNAEFQYCGRSYRGEIPEPECKAEFWFERRISLFVQIALAPNVSEECYQRHGGTVNTAQTNGISMSLQRHHLSIGRCCAKVSHNFVHWIAFLWALNGSVTRISRERHLLCSSNHSIDVEALTTKVQRRKWTNSVNKLT